MTRLTATLLFAALASAEYTTTIWMTKIAKSDKYGYVASVIDADAQQITMSLDYDSDTQRNALYLGAVEGNFTFGPSSFKVNQGMTQIAPTPTGDINYSLACTQAAQPDDDTKCERVVGDAYARYAFCNEQLYTRYSFLPANTTTTFPHTYGTGLWGSGGVETITLTYDWPPASPTTTPEWCTSDNVPASFLTFPFTVEASSFAYYRVVVTAGEEKLSAYSGSSLVLSTTSGSTVQVPSATQSAGNSGNATASSTTSLPQSTGAAGKIRAVVPAVAGMGVAAVMGML